MANYGIPLDNKPARRQLPLLDPVRFTRKHPEVRITAPHSATGKWEVSSPNAAAAAYDGGADMMDEPEKRYPS